MKSFIYRNSRPQPMAAPAPKRISTPAGQRLSVIMESGANAGGQPARHGTSRLMNMPFARRLHMGDAPLYGDEKRPPSYASGPGSAGSSGGVPMLPGGTGDDGVGRPYNLLPEGMRDSMGKRGGWRRIILIVVALVILLAIGLGVGLGVGLSMSKSKSSSSSGSNSNNNSPAQKFPAGSWSFTTFLSNISTACTATSDTWTCSPYNTYSTADPTAARTIFNWIITQSSSDSSQYYITNNNVFLQPFTNVSLSFLDANTATERYTFSIPNTSKQVSPATSLTSDNSLTSCFYNDTTFEASLYTRMSKTVDPDGQPAVSDTVMQAAASAYKEWPWAVRIEQLAHGGAGVPSCYRTQDGEPVGSPIDLQTEPSSTSCSCSYENYGF